MDPARLTRVVAQHGPALFAILGLFAAADCANVLELTDEDGPHTYYKAATKRDYVLYKAAIRGHGGSSARVGGSL